MICTVIDDEVKVYTKKGATEPTTTRVLHVVDMDDGDRLREMVGITIPMDDPATGKAREAALRGMQVEVSVSGIRVLPWDHSLGFTGRVLNIAGRVVIQPVTVQPTK